MTRPLASVIGGEEDRTFSLTLILPTNAGADAMSASLRMRQTYLMLSLILIVVLAAHFVKTTRYNQTASDAMTESQVRSGQYADAMEAGDDDDDEELASDGRIVFVEQ